MADSDSALRDVLWKMYQEHCTQGRHHETQRATVAGAVIAIAGALVGIITFDKAVDVTDLPLTFFLFFLGSFGAIFSSKQHERFRLHMERASAYRNELDKHLSNAPLKRLKRQADEKHNRKYPKLSKLALNRFWVGLNLFIVALALLLGLVAAFNSWKTPASGGLPQFVCNCAVNDLCEPVMRRDGQ